MIDEIYLYSKVTLKGAKNCVDAAKEKISSLIEDLESQVTIACVIEQQHHRYVLHTYLINRSQWLITVYIFLKLHPILFSIRTIMGARGSNIQNVCADFNVQIKIPDRKSNKPQQNGTTNGQNEEINGNDSSDIIRISGKKENCEDASEALRALVPINIEVTF